MKTLNMNICANFHGNPSCGCRDIWLTTKIPFKIFSVWIKVIDITWAAPLKYPKNSKSDREAAADCRKYCRHFSWSALPRWVQVKVIILHWFSRVSLRRGGDGDKREKPTSNRRSVKALVRVRCELWKKRLQPQKTVEPCSVRAVSEVSSLGRNNSLHDVRRCLCKPVPPQLHLLFPTSSVVTNSNTTN